MFNTKPWNAGFPGIPKEVEQDISNLQSRTAALETANTYSSTETVIGKFDGKTLYRKVYTVDALPNNDYKYIPSGLTDVTIVRIYGAAGVSGLQIPIPYIDMAGLGSGVSLHYSSTNNIVLRTGTDKSTYSGFIVLEYYKNPVTKDGDTEPEKEPEKEPEEVKEPETKATKKAKKGE